MILKRFVTLLLRSNIIVSINNLIKAPHDNHLYKCLVPASKVLRVAWWVSMLLAPPFPPTSLLQKCLLRRKRRRINSDNRHYNPKMISANIWKYDTSTHWYAVSGGNRDWCCLPLAALTQWLPDTTHVGEALIKHQASSVAPLTMCFQLRAPSDHSRGFVQTRRTKVTEKQKAAMRGRLYEKRAEPCIKFTAKMRTVNKKDEWDWSRRGTT